MQCDVQNEECYINMSAVMQPPFQLWFSADQCGHSFMAPKLTRDVRKFQAEKINSLSIFRITI